jgi:carboxylesterase type B
VAYAFGNIGMSVAKQFGFRNPQAAMAARGVGRGAGRGPATGSVSEDANEFREVEDSPQGRQISDAMLAYWVAFMRHGDPSVEGWPNWTGYTAANRVTMVFGNRGIQLQQEEGGK